ncbi:MAG TPA: hypothetical protein VGT40_23915 [Methylomirabilota bacterium]|jgi:hypothetical protein|nr:hypothetical protein [Methylomirabilota bacterium]
MYTLIRLIPVKRLLLEQAPALAVSFAIAEAFYKFHSFTLECLAFLATWFVADAVIQPISRRVSASLIQHR